MVTKTDIELKNFFVFNSTFGPKEGQVSTKIISLSLILNTYSYVFKELKKILFYYPFIDNSDQQIKNVGLVEGIIQFTR